MDHPDQSAPGKPGFPPTWTSSNKSGVGTALSATSRVWFSLSQGILTEIYYPRLDQACVRDLGLIITDGTDFFSEEKRDTTSQIQAAAAGIPAYRLVNTCNLGRYRIEKEILTDPQRDVLLQRTRFMPLTGKLDDYHLFVLLAPHLGNRGFGNSAWVGDYKGVPMLFASREGYALALACSSGWQGRSAGYVGISDGWQDLHQHSKMTWFYPQAGDGNVALTGEVDLHNASGMFILALGFGANPSEAGFRVRSSLERGFAEARKSYIQGWKAWQKMLLPLDEKLPEASLYRTSSAVLRAHEAKRFPGGLIASLSIPWGETRGDYDSGEKGQPVGGYHLVWTRDLVEAAGGLLAAGARDDVRRVLAYLQTTQEADGHWPQNMWLDGRPYWSGVQLDETAFPILLVDRARQEAVLGHAELVRLWPMVRQAAIFILANGPVTQQDRWEEDPGYSPFTLAVEIAALLAAADLADLNDEPDSAELLRQTADHWNANIERWTYARETDLASQMGVDGYYVRLAPPDEAEASTPAYGYVPIKNRPPGESQAQAIQIVSPDALALVRFGLRAPDDARILNTVKVIDALLKVETPFGLAWRRYNGDGYGENRDGSAFNGSGIGRAWPLLTGERAHYELAAGHDVQTRALLNTLNRFSNSGGMLPEQVWDEPDLPEKGLFYGCPSGSAAPLVWAHAEYIKICRSLVDGRVFDQPDQPVQRYQVKHVGSELACWQFNLKIRSCPVGKTLRLCLLEPAIVHWTTGSWVSGEEAESHPTRLGLHLVDLPTRHLPSQTILRFTIYWLESKRWEGQDYQIEIIDG